MRRNRKDHAHLELAALVSVGFHNRLERIGLDRVGRLAVCAFGYVGLHLLPDLVGDRDAIAVEIHAAGGNNVGLGAETNGRANRLPGQHVRPVEFAVNDAIEQHLPIGLRLQGDEKPLVLKEELLLGNDQGRAVGQLDETELEFVFFQF